MEISARDRFQCSPVCRFILSLERGPHSFGPAGDTAYVPLRITGGAITGIGAEKAVVFGSDFAAIYPDEKLVHDGRFAVSDPAGDILFDYGGTSQGDEGAYDDALEGKLPERIPCRLSVTTLSANPNWRPFNRRLFLGIGWFDARRGILDVTLLSVSEGSGQN